MAKNRRIRPNENSTTCPPEWVWLLAGIVNGLFISFLIYLQKIAPHTASEKMLLPLTTENLPSSATTQSTVPILPSHFEFYDVLPHVEVKIPETGGNKLEQSLVQQNTPKTPQDQQNNLPVTVPGRYLLQIGSFRNESEAQGLKTYLNTLGVKAYIQKTHLDESGSWYRVQLGPFTDLKALNQIHTKLINNNIQPILQKF